MNLIKAIGNAFREILSDESIASTLLVGVLIYSFFYPAGYDQQVAMQLPVAIVDLDHSVQSRNIIRKAETVRGIKIAAFPDSMLEAEMLLSQRIIDGILLIPSDFSKNALGGRKGTIAIYSNAGYSVRNATVLGSLASVVGGEALDLVEHDALNLGIISSELGNVAEPIKLIQRPLFNRYEGYGSYAVPAAAQLIVHQTLFFGLVMLLGKRRKLGTLPLGETEFLGIFIAFLFIGITNSLYFNGFGFWLQDYPRAENVPGLILVTVLYVSAIIGLSLFVGSFFDKEFRAMQILACTSLPLFFLSGIAWPVSALPEPLQYIAQVFPSTAGINAYIKVNQMGAHISEIFRELVTLSILAGSFTLLGYYRLSRKKPKNQQ